MPTPSQTDQITTALDHYLTEHCCFDEAASASCRQIADVWAPPFQDAIRDDIARNYPGLTIGFIYHEFELAAENEHGSPCLFFHKARLSDPITEESLGVYIKTLVSYNKTIIYLDSTYAVTAHWPGASPDLQDLFQKLKSADKEPGYFSPVRLNDI